MWRVNMDDPYILSNWEAIRTFFEDSRKCESLESPLRGHYTRDRKMMDVLGYNFECGWEREREMEMEAISVASLKIIPLLYDEIEIWKNEFDVLSEAHYSVLSKINKFMHSLAE